MELRCNAMLEDDDLTSEKILLFPKDEICRIYKTAQMVLNTCSGASSTETV